MKTISILNWIIAFYFYALFFFVPLIFAGNTSELFELNKIWLTYTIAIIIGIVWCIKMALQKRFFIQRTPLDIFLLLFLLSQVISTIFSLDSYVSFWGYYSRFNGGLLSTITYIFLYYAFVSNLGKKQVIRILQVTLVSGLLVALWGLPSHFGYDPTCFVFRGDFDVSCWTDAFQPKVRIFSTLGQPDWLAAYLVALIPVAIAFGISYFKKGKIPQTLYYYFLSLLFFVDLLFTRARSGVLGIVGVFFFFFIIVGWISTQKWWQRISLTISGLIAYVSLLLLQWKDINVLFFTFIICSLLFLVLLIVITFQNKVTFLYQHIASLGIFVGTILLLMFFIGTPIDKLNQLTLLGIQNTFHKTSAPVVTKAKTPGKQTSQPAGEFGGTDSGKIRLFVWRGAFDVWRHYPLFGSGVETFAFAYYKFRPVGHNLTSEWDYLYNKAHNEFLNYLATTGIFGLGTYVLFIGVFFFLAVKHLPNAITVTTQTIKHKKFGVTQTTTDQKLLVIALMTAVIGILITNFFGFSVVIMNIFLFLLPAFVLLLENRIPTVLANQSVRQSSTLSSDPNGLTEVKQSRPLTIWQYLPLSIMMLIAMYFFYSLFRFWQADTAYALGSNYDHAGYYQNANQLLRSAVEQKPEESVFADELSSNDAVIAAALAGKKDSTNAAKFAQEAVTMSNQAVQNHPNNIIFWKTRVRVFYSLAQIDPQYLRYALQAIQKANELAPTDAKISYNLGLLYSQTGDIQKAVSVMENTVRLKRDYRDAYYALGLFYHQAALDKDGKTIVNQDLQQKAVKTMQYILFHFSPDDTGAKDSLKNWGIL